VVARTYSAAAIALWFVALVQQDKLPGFDFTSWFGIIAMAFVSQLVGHTGINASLKWFSANTVALSTLVEPVAAASLAFFVFAEYLSWQGIIGGGLVLAGLIKVLSLEANDKAA
jgi:drug/metabolite transporter (DMT)-like permease